MVNYPRAILEKIENKSMWSLSLGLFFLSNVIYLFHNLIENKMYNQVGETLSDHIVYLLFYITFIIVFWILMKILGIGVRLSTLAQYVFVTSIFSSILYVADLPLLFAKIDGTKILEVLELLFIFWISLAFTGKSNDKNKKILITFFFMLAYYSPTVLTKILLLI